MRHTAILVGKSDIVVRRETVRDIVGTEQRNLGDVGQTRSAQHLDVGPRDGVDTGAAPRGRRDGADGLGGIGRGDDGVGGEEWSEVGFARDGADTRSTTTVGNGEGL